VTPFGAEVSQNNAEECAVLTPLVPLAWPGLLPFPQKHRPNEQAHADRKNRDRGRLQRH
jgi:hypothetical protein